MKGEPVHEMFRNAAARFGDRTAIELQDRRTTYRELAERAAGLAARLREAGAGNGALVAVLAATSEDVIAAILAVLEAGCAFVPFDLHFPSARLEAAVAEVRPRWWLADPAYGDHLERLGEEQGLDLTVIPFDSLPGHADGARPPAAPLDPDALCYVYFTSGSTGRPKGIAGRLKAIDHFIRWEIETLGLGEDCRVSQLTSPAFDAFLRDAFVPLAAGGTVCVPPGRHTLLDGARLADWIDRQRLTLVHCTPSLFRSLLNQPLTADRFAALRHVLLAGEALLPSDVKRWHAVFGGRIELVNLYGPTETTMIKLFYRVRPEDGDALSVPIGQPMAGARAIVVDERGQPCPTGKLGEIYIRTPYRTHGYLNRPDLTGEVFVQNPFSDRPDDIVYKTGDLGRIRDDGNFEFVGRRDQQVKVRGVRIELAPIEDALRSHEAVSEAVVVDRTDTQGNKFLCAYVVLRQEVEISRLGDWLRERLPESMVPAAFVLLETLPKTLSGKVDRRALPDPGQAGRVGREYVAPSTPVEERLCQLFGELLGIDKVGVEDSFFELGGHSLLATLLLSRIRSQYYVEVPLQQVFRTPDVRALALTVTRLQLEQLEQGEGASLLSEIEMLSEDSLERLLERGAE